MKRKAILAFTLAMLMLILPACNTTPSSSSSPSSVAPPSGPVYNTRTFKLADNHPDGYPTVLGDLKFAELLSQKTGGAMTVEVHNNGVLGDEKTVVEQVQIGAIDFTRVGTGILGPVTPEMNALSLPYLYRDTEHMFKVLDGPIGDEFLNKMYKDGLLGLCWYDAGARNFYNIKKEIHTPEDMKGLKIRVQESELMLTLVSSLGANPTPMAYAEVYSGLQTSVIEGAENNWPSYMTQSHYEVAKYFTVDAHTRSPEMIIISTSVWESLNADEQAVVKECALEAAKFERAEWARQEKDYEQQAIAAGSIITYLSPEEFQLFVDAVQPVYELDAYKGYADIVNKIKNTK